MAKLNCECQHRNCTKRAVKLVSPTRILAAPIEKYVPYCRGHAKNLSLDGYHVVNP